MDHLEVTEADMERKSPDGQCSEDDPLVAEVRRYYTLPGLRFGNVIRILLFLDGISSLSLWLAGGNSKYFVDNIIQFHILESTFDLALISATKLVLLVILYSLLEDLTMKELETPYNQTLASKKRATHIGCIAVSFITLTYSVVKGSLILNAILYDTAYERMHITYNILVISTVVFSLLELMMALYSFRAMRKLKVVRVLHRYNNDGLELDKDGQPIQKKAPVNLKRLIGLAKPEAGLMLLAIFFLICASAAQTAAPLFFGMVVDSALKSMAELNRTVIILFVVYVGGSIASSFRSWLFTLASQHLVARLRKELFANIIKQEVAFFDVNRTGELNNRLASDTQVIQNAVTVNVSMLARNLLQIIGSLVLMFVLNASLTGVLLAVVPVVSVAAMQYGKFLMKLRKEFQDRLADSSTTAEESLSSIRTVRSFVGEPKSVAAYSVDIDKSYKIGKKLAILQGFFDGTIGLLAYGSITLVLWYGGKLVNEGKVTPGILTSFLLYMLQVAMSFALLSSLYGDFMQAVGASVRIFELLDRNPEIPCEGGQTLSATKPELEFKNVDFIYPSRPDSKVLKGVSFSISSGQMVALVGPSGGGKSTIVSLIERFYDPNAGTITLGGFDLKQLDPSSFRKRVAMVGQEPTLFACSIKDNIAYGINASEEQVIEAAKQANAHDFISTFEEGYNTLVGERGIRLSGGQKQRVAIARALIVDPDILLLDEATSALDAESEHLVQEAVDRAMQNRTVLVIAHRLSTVRSASKVIVIDKGEIAEQGTHEELLKLNGVYKKLVLRQLMAGATDNLEPPLVDNFESPLVDNLEPPLVDNLEPPIVDNQEPLLVDVDNVEPIKSTSGDFRSLPSKHLLD